MFNAQFGKDQRGGMLQKTIPVSKMVKQGRGPYAHFLGHMLNGEALQPQIVDYLQCCAGGGLAGDHGLGRPTNPARFNC